MKKWFVVLAMVPLYFTLGCGGGVDTTVVTGTVTLDGTPVEKALVNFTPEGGGGLPSYAHTKADGTFALQTPQGEVGGGTTPGTYVVTVTKNIPTPTGAKRKNSSGVEEDVMENKNEIPEIYAIPKTSPLKETVVAGQENNFKLELTSK